MDIYTWKVTAKLCLSIQTGKKVSGHCGTGIRREGIIVLAYKQVLKVSGYFYYKERGYEVIAKRH